VAKLVEPTVYRSVAQIAEERGVAKTTVAAWIQSGELKAESNSRSPTSKKPRYIVSEAAYAEFKSKMATGTVALAVHKRRRASDVGRHAEALRFFTAAKQKRKPKAT
jgi:transposase